MPTPGDHPRRVAMVSLHTSPMAEPGVGDAGGLNVYVAELARRLAARGVDIDVFTRRVDPSTPEYVDLDERVRVVQVPAGPAASMSKEDLPALVAPFAAELRRRVADYDLLHTHYWLSGLAGREVAAARGLPLVHTMHTMARVKNAAREEGHRVEPDEREDGEAKVVRAAQILTANTTDEAKELEEHYAARPEQIVIVPPGVDLRTFHPCDQPASRLALHIGAEDDVVLFVGRIQPLKAPDVLIRAVAELRRRDRARWSRLRLVVIGGPSGPDSGWSASLPRLVGELGVDDAVTFRPHAARDELFRWYCASDVVGVPSYNESFGLVALEAQACGRPVVATDVGGLRHAVRDGRTGLLVDGHHATDWADALAFVLDNPLRAERMGRAAGTHAATFSWDATAAATLTAYDLAAHALAAGSS